MAGPAQPVSPVEELAHASIPTQFGRFAVHVFRQTEPAKSPTMGGSSTHNEHVALVLGDVRGKDVLARVHSECLTGEVFGSLRCDCRGQFEAAQAAIAKEGAGVIVYLRQEGRGIGLANKIKAYALQDQGVDTVDANQMLRLPIDGREYDVAAAVFTQLGVASVRLLTNNPTKVTGLQALGITVSERVPLVVAATEHSSQYLQTKRRKLKHDLPSGAHSTPPPLKK